MAAHSGTDKERGLEGNWSSHNHKRNGAEERQLETYWRPVADCGIWQELGIGQSPPPATEKKNKQETGQTQDNEHNNKDRIICPVNVGTMQRKLGMAKNYGSCQRLKNKKFHLLPVIAWHNGTHWASYGRDGHDLVPI